MKKCSLCKLEKDLDCFARKGEGKQPHCKPCQKLKIREWYKANKAHQLQRVEATKKRILEETGRLKSGPCTDCLRSFPPYVMDWDHVRGEKIDNVSTLIAGASLKKALDEIAKCELVCANCHRIRTHNRYSESKA